MDGGAWRAAVHGVAESDTAEATTQQQPIQETQETQVQSLGREDPQEEEIATHSDFLTWRIPWTEEPGGLQSMGSKKSWTRLSVHTHTHTHTRTGGSREGLPLLASWDPGLRRESLSWLLKGEKDPKWDYISGQQLAAHA